MKGFMAALFLATASATVCLAQGQWIKVGSYQNYGVYSTNLEARLISKEWDSNAETYRVIFQINAQGKDVGAMEFDVVCKNGYFSWERQIVVPTSGARFFSSGAEPYFQKAKLVARDMFCK